MDYKINDYTFKYVNPTTCKSFDMSNNYNYSHDITLSDVYGNPSTAKQYAFERCLKICAECNGYNYKIPTFNSQRFTFAFLVNCIKGNDYVNIATHEHGTELIPDFEKQYANTVTYIVYITANNMYITDYTD